MLEEIDFPWISSSKQKMQEQSEVVILNLVNVQMLLEALKNELQMKIWWVPFGENFQSNEHRNFVFSPINLLDI